MASQFRSTSLGARHLDVAEHVRMAADEFVGKPVRHVVKREIALLASDLRLKRDLQQQIAQFFLVALLIARIYRIQDLVAFFNRDRLEGLRASVRGPRDSRAFLAAG